MNQSATISAPTDRSSNILVVLVWILGVILVFAVSVGLLWAHSTQIQTQRSVLTQTSALGPRVLVMRVQEPTHQRQIPIPASIHGYIETSVYAKTPGYLKSIYVDKGDRVHKGEVLAVLTSPELDKQVADAKANYWLERVTDKRNQELVMQQVIPQQLADNSHAAMLRAKAAYEQLVATQAYEVITAVSDGIITARYVDPGALIPQVTTPGGSTPIVDLATLRPLRVYADVPQDLGAFVRNGDAATVTVTQFPGRRFPGKVTRHPEALASDTRTMRVEVDLPNLESALYPGMYATVVLNVLSTENTMSVPDDALVFRHGDPYVPVIRNSRVHLARVVLGNDDGREVEIASGVSAGDIIAVNVGEGVEEDDPVQPVALASAN